MSDLLTEATAVAELACYEELDYLDEDMLRVSVAAVVPIIRERVALAIEASFRAWDEAGDTHAPHPMHSESWLVERAYADAADTARSGDLS